MQPARDFWRGRRVLVTGHSGFKGGWLSLWLHSLGAEVVGLALPPATEPSLFSILPPETFHASIWADIADLHRLALVFDEYRPEVVFHLAAQALVREGYANPVRTFATNALGTVHVLEAIRLHAPGLLAAVMVTSDKCYLPRAASAAGFDEADALGGYEPYASSKACAELATLAYRESFLRRQGVPVATARAGNVIGGGDWSENRLIPDIIRAFLAGSPVRLRYPGAIRPWQHVLEPLRGYLRLAECLARDSSFSGAWNFGPASTGSTVTVAALADRVIEIWGGGTWAAVAPDLDLPETAELRLDSSRAARLLDWYPAWDIDAALQATVDWYRAAACPASLVPLMRRQIADYQRDCANAARAAAANRA